MTHKGLNMNYYKAQINKFKEEIRGTLKTIRSNTGLTQKDVSKLMGMTEEHYGAYYENESSITVEKLIQFTEKLKYEINKL